MATKEALAEGAVNSDVKVKKAVVLKAVRALKQVVEKRRAHQNPLFAESTETMTVQFSISKIPERLGHPAVIPLPHPLYTDKSEVCFLSKTPQKKYKELLLQKHPVPGVTKVIGVEKLKRRYRGPEEKRALADSFDLFICDMRVWKCMREALGNAFFKQKLKFPVPVTLKEGSPDPTVHIRKAMDGTIFKLAFGPCIGVRFGRCGMPEEELAANAAAVIAHSIKLLSKYGLLLQSIGVQATDSMALPVWKRPAPPGERVNLKQWREQQASSAASDTGASGVSDSEITGSEIISDAGETLSTLSDTDREIETGGETMSEIDTAGETLSEMDSEADEIAKEDLPLMQGLKKKKRKREGTEVIPPPVKAPKKKAKKGKTA